MPSGSGMCGGNELLIISPDQCPNCSDFIDCASCIQSGLCEWMVEEAECKRKGR